MVPGETKQIAVTVHYDGGAFFGWQLQRDRPSVQGELERVLSRLFDAPARVTGAGRTDRGVHSVGQVATVLAPATWTARDLRRALNALLRRGVWVADAAEVARDFHPRYGAVSRSYRYRVGLSEAAASPFQAPWCWPLRRPLRLDAMERATGALPGEHSFRAFAKAGQEERGDRCEVFSAEWSAWGSLGVEFRITANRFLHHMVRYLVGTIVDIGLARRPEEDLRGLLSGEGSLETSPPAPPQGLFLSAVTYAPGAYAGPDEVRNAAALPSG
jgi:tRNA pseudouridine38-40 synthase